MVIVAKQLDLMNIWGTYFAVTLIVTFLVTAITVRIPPLRTIPDEYCEGVKPDPEKSIEGSRVKNAWREAMLGALPARSYLGEPARWSAYGRSDCAIHYVGGAYRIAACALYSHL